MGMDGSTTGGESPWKIIRTWITANISFIKLPQWRGTRGQLDGSEWLAYVPLSTAHTGPAHHGPGTADTASHSLEESGPEPWWHAEGRWGRESRQTDREEQNLDTSGTRVYVPRCTASVPCLSSLELSGLSVKFWMKTVQGRCGSCCLDWSSLFWLRLMPWVDDKSGAMNRNVSDY